MKFWTKGWYDLVNGRDLVSIFAKLSDESATTLKEINFPIKITDCDGQHVYAFADSSGRDYKGTDFGFTETDSVIFTYDDRQKHFKKINYSPAKAESNEIKELIALVKSAHLFGNVRIGDTLVTKPDDFIKLMRESRDKRITSVERDIEIYASTLESKKESLKLLRGV